LKEVNIMTIYYDNLTWPEINDAVADKKIPIIAVGSVEQHGPHLPLKTDWFQAHKIVEEAAVRSEERLLVMPPMHYGYITHAMDFPGTITIHWQHLIEFCLDITKSLAYHGFKKMILVNGHGSNSPILELVARRTNLETDAICATLGWWRLLSVDPAATSKWRETGFPSGAHAEEMETSMILHLDPETVKMEHAGNFQPPDSSKFLWSDITKGSGPVGIISWTSLAGTNGTFGRADLGTAEKGKIIFEEAVKQLVAFVKEFDAMPLKTRVDHHKEPPTTPEPG
jgi:creatinine amidohydrolase